ncbi:MAG: hypothetical protein ACT4PU_04310 [Planctomycetota bacterium]
MSRRGLWLLAALCAAPHLARLLLPTLAPNDGCYAHAALMIARGYEPYLHFTHVAFPFLEQLLALPLRIFGADLRVFEIATQLVIGLIAVLLYRAGARLAGPLCGAVAALAWSWSLWVLHFNLLERETWSAVGVALALLLVARRADVRTSQNADTSASWAAAALLALAFGLAFFVKITAVVAIGGLLLHLVLSGRLRLALRAGALFLLLAAGVTALSALIWGRPFLWQVFLFGFFRNVPEHDSGQALRTLLLWTDPVTLLGFVGLLTVGLTRLGGVFGGAACVLAAQLVYAVALSPTLWEHNLIDFAPAGALLCGGLVEALRDPARRRRVGLLSALALLGLIGAIGLAARLPPAAGGLHAWLGTAEESLQQWGPYGPGLGGWPRETLSKRAAFLQKHSAPDEIVATVNPWWALHGDRIEFVRYWDVQAVAQGLEASLLADGLRTTLGKRQGPLLLGPGLPPHDPRAETLGSYRGREFANALVYIRPAFLDALARREIGLVVEPLVPGLLGEADLRAAGYERIEDHDLGQIGWRPPGGRSEPRVRELFSR